MSKRSRRQLLADAGKTAALAGISGCFPDVGGSWPEVTAACTDPNAAIAGKPAALRSRVVEVEREDSVIERVDPTSGAMSLSVRAEAMRPMLDAALIELARGAADPWRAILPDYTPATRIGVKVNCLNDQLTTSVPLVKALVDSLREGLGASSEQIIVWDRRLDELQPAPPRVGFTEETVGARVMGTYRSTTDTSGPGYSEPFCGMVAGRTPRLSRILTELTDVTINVPVLKTHTVSGITGAMKNIYGVIDNPGEYHTNLVTALPSLYRLPPIRDRIRVTILDALIAVTVGGTSSPPDTWPRRILAATDPVALDSCALALVNRLRSERKGVTLGPVDSAATRWLEGSREFGLGSLEYDQVAITM